MKKSRRIALDIIDDAKDIIEEINVRNVKLDIEGDVVPSTSNEKPKRPTELVKYGKITFSTTAILHHYPQMANDYDSLKVATKKSDLNLPEDDKSGNNNEITKLEDRDNYNNNDTSLAKDKIDVLNKPMKFTEEKLV